MNELNVIFVAPLPPPYGGIANWMAMLSRYLSKEKASEIEYTVIDTSPKKRVTEGRGLLQRIMGGFISLIKTSFELRKELKRCKPDCVHITTSGSLGLMRDRVVLKILAKRKINSVYHIHFGRVADVLKINNWEGKLLRSNFRLADSIVTIDDVTYKSLMKNEFGEKCYNIPNFINLEELPQQRDKIEKKVTFIGWVIPTKGIDELIKAWKGINSELIKEWKLEIIGPYNKDYIDTFKIRNSDNIVLTDELEHNKTLERLNRSSIFVLPSYTEGFPNSVLEAMALGKTVIATDVGAIPQMLSNDCGILIKAKDVEELKSALIKVMTENVDEFGIKALKRVKEEYEISKVVEQYIKLWRKNNVI